VKNIKQLVKSFFILELVEGVQNFLSTNLQVCKIDIGWGTGSEQGKIKQLTDFVGANSINQTFPFFGLLCTAMFMWLLYK